MMTSDMQVNAGEKEKAETPTGLRKNQLKFSVPDVWEEEVNQTQSKGRHPKNELCDQFLYWEDLQWAAQACLEVANVKR